MSKTRKLLLEFDTDEVGRLAREKPSEKKALIKAFTDSSDVVRERALIAAIDVVDPTIVEDIINKDIGLDKNGGGGYIVCNIDSFIGEGRQDSVLCLFDRFVNVIRE